MDKKILVAEEVAAIFRVDKQRIYELTRTNQLPGIIRLGERQYRYSAQAIEQFLHAGGTHKEGENNDSN